MTTSDSRTDAHLIRPALWRTPAEPINQTYRTVEFPTAWVDAFGRRDRTPPLAALTCAAKTLAPGIRHAVPIGPRRGEPLLWAEEGLNPDEDALGALVEEWIGVAFNDEQRPTVRAAVRNTPLHWQDAVTIDLAAWEAGDNGTTTPAHTAQFPLLAEYVARVLEQSPLSVLDTNLSLRRVQRGRAEPDGELLVSWPPFAETCRRRGATWTELWAVQLHVRVVTLAWDPAPRIAVEFSRRRFLARPVTWVRDTIYRQRVNALAWWPKGNPLMVGGLRGEDRLVQLSLRWSRGDQGRILAWDDATGRLLDRLDLDLRRERFDPALLPQKPTRYRPSGTATGLLVGYRSGVEPTSGLGSGFWQVDHCLLRAAVDDVLANANFVGDDPLGPPDRPLLASREPPRVTGCLEAWFQNNDSLQAVVSAVDGLCGPGEELESRSGPRTWSYLDGGFLLAGCPLPAGWAQPLAERIDVPPEPTPSPIAERAQSVTRELPRPEAPTVSIVELPPKDAWRHRSHLDPYIAVRRGFVASGRGVQGLEATEGQLWGQAPVKHRAKQATLDAIRQLGVQLRCSEAVEPLAGGVRQVAFVPVERHDTTAGRAGVYPIVLVIDRDATASGLAFGDTDLQPLPDLIRRFGTGDVRPLDIASRSQQLRQWDSFVDDFVTQLAEGPPTLLMLQRNTRWWRTLADKNIRRDTLVIPRAAEHGPHRSLTPAQAPNLRIARIDTDVARHAGVLVDGNVSTTHGVYKAGERRFLSRGRKPRTRQVAENRSTFGSHQRRATRAGRNYAAGDWRVEARDPIGAGWNPSTVEFLLFFLQPDDDPAAWAAYMHAQRHLAIQFSDPLQVPAVVHNARLAQEHLDLVDDPLRRSRGRGQG